MRSILDLINKTAEGKNTNLLDRYIADSTFKVEGEENSTLSVDGMPVDDRTKEDIKKTKMTCIMSQIFSL